VHQKKIHAPSARDLRGSVHFSDFVMESNLVEREDTKGMSEKLTRRVLIKTLGGAVAASIFHSKASALRQEENGSELTGRERGEMGRLAAAFKRQYEVPGLSIAISRNGQFVYDRGFGVADRKDAVELTTSNVFRIASLTKPITSVAIFTLIEKGQLHLNDKVFGPSAILGTKYGKGTEKQYVGDITVDHLLTHTAGGWPNDSTDPMFQHESWDHTKLISWTLENMPLSYPPGQHWAYSNFGYCVLGRVIEQVSGQPYADYVQASVLGPAGISGMSIAENSMKKRAPNEVVYYGQYSEDPYKINVTRMDSHGGWIATPSNLVQFLDHLGSPNMPSLLKPETIRTMTTPSPAYPKDSPARYARGWLVRDNGAGNWWHNGSLPGSTTIMVRTSTGMCWAALANTRTQPSDEISTALDKLIWNMVQTVARWNA
jgi:CubicO group peptidase (beta-lactamase class C family)